MIAQYAVKILVLSIAIVAVTEAAKRWPFWAAAATSVPAVSLAALVLLYIDLGEPMRAGSLSHAMFWMCFPGIVLLGSLPLLLRLGWPFWPSLAAACGLFGLVFLGVFLILKRLGLGPA